MSSSTRSKPASPSSPPTGSATDVEDAADEPDEPDGDEDEDRPEPPPAGPLRPVAVELEISRQRAITWTLGGPALGILLITQLGTVGVWVGILLCVIAALHAIGLVQSLLYPPGTIIVTDKRVTLPRGLCKPHPVEVTPADVTAAYFLRRSVPWNKSSPVLVIEVGPRALVFPRDWFASEADQRHVIDALLRRRPVAAAA